MKARPTERMSSIKDYPACKSFGEDFVALQAAVEARDQGLHCMTSASKCENPSSRGELVLHKVGSLTARNIGIRRAVREQ